MWLMKHHHQKREEKSLPKEAILPREAIEARDFDFSHLQLFHLLKKVHGKK